MSITPPKADATPTAPRGLVTTAMSAVKPKALNWLVPDLIPLGRLTVIAGDGGVGKSTLVAALAADVTRGQPAFGLKYPATGAADVLLIGCEDDTEDTVAPRLIAAGADLDRVHRVDGTPALDKGGKVVTRSFDLSRVDCLAEQLDGNRAIRLVVIDPANAFLPPGVDEHRDAELRTCLGPLAEVAARFGAAVVLVKHFNKGAGAKASHRIAGSAGWVNASRAAFVVAVDPSNPARRLMLPVKGNHTDGASGLAFSIERVPPTDAARLVSGFDHLDALGRAALAVQLVAVKWGGTVRESADEVLCEPVRTTRVGECEKWLRGFVGVHAWPDAELSEAAVEAGFTADNLQKAKARLKKQSPALVSQPIRSGGPWFHWFGQRDNPRPIRPETPDMPETGEPAPETPETEPERPKNAKRSFAQVNK